MPDLMLAQQKHLALFAKAEIRAVPVRQVDLANELRARRPHVYTVPTPAIYIAGHVTLDSVRDTDIGKGEKAAVHKERRAMTVNHVVSIAVCGLQHLHRSKVQASDSASVRSRIYFKRKRETRHRTHIDDALLGS